MDIINKINLIVEKEKKMTFVRYGGLSKVKYKKRSDDFFHSPPKKKGIFAFVWPYIDDFLWAWKFKNSYDKEMEILIKKYGETFFDIPKYEREKLREKFSEEFLKKELEKERKRIGKKFQYSGYLWTHLTDYTTNAKRKGSWVEVHTTDFDRMIKKFIHDHYNDLINSLKTNKLTKKNFHNLLNSLKTNKPNIDMLEVFIEKIN